MRTALQAIQAMWCQHYEVCAKRRGFILFKKERLIKIKNHFKADVQFPDYRPELRGCLAKSSAPPGWTAACLWIFLEQQVFKKNPHSVVTECDWSKTITLEYTQKSKQEALSITYEGKISANAKHFPIHDHSGMLWQITQTTTLYPYLEVPKKAYKHMIGHKSENNLKLQAHFLIV